MQNITTRPFSKGDWMGFAGAQGEPRIAEIDTADKTIVIITDDTGLSVHVYESSDDGYPGWYKIDCTQELAEHVLAKINYTDGEDLLRTMDVIAEWNDC